MKTKTKQWVMFTYVGGSTNPENGETIACPQTWLAKDPSHYERFRMVSDQYVGAQPAHDDVDQVLEPGVFSKLTDIEGLFVCTNYVYTLVDEGYIDHRKALLAFKEVPSE